DRMLFFYCRETADAGADDDAHAIRIDLRRIQGRVVDRHIRGGERKLREAIHAPDGFLVDVFLGFKSLDFGVDLTRVIGGVKKREAPYSRTTILERVPKGFNANTDRSNNPHPGNHYTFFHFDFMTGNARARPGIRMERGGRLTSSCGL